ncbi:MAG: hypothetical protein HKN54_04130 [Flavobacteriaceae bacterium]|nr:hypothetical protein [Flavobacteriaceae bacterium]
MFTYIVALNLIISTYAQQEKVLFSDAISLHLSKYRQNCQDAVNNKDFERVDRLFDSLVQNHLKGTFLEDLSIRKLSGGFFKTDSLRNPVLLTTTTAWYIKNDEEIEALNNLASEFNGKIDVVVLFWDTKKKVKKAAKPYSKEVIIIYVDETLNLENSIINTYKHALGIPTAFYIGADKKIVSIDRGGLNKFTKARNPELYAANYEIYHRNMTQLLISDGLLKDTILTGTD